MSVIRLKLDGAIIALVSFLCPVIVAKASIIIIIIIIIMTVVVVVVVVDVICELGSHSL